MITNIIDQRTPAMKLSQYIAGIESEIAFVKECRDAGTIAEEVTEEDLDRLTYDLDTARQELDQHGDGDI